MDNSCSFTAQIGRPWPEPACYRRFWVKRAFAMRQEANWLIYNYAVIIFINNRQIDGWDIVLFADVIIYGNCLRFTKFIAGPGSFVINKNFTLNAQFLN